MEEKPSHKEKNIYRNIFYIIFSILNMSVTLPQIVAYEAKKAERSLFLTIANYIVVLFLFVIMWVTLLGLLAVNLLQHQFTWTAIIWLIFSINFIAALVILLITRNMKQQTFFPQTRRLLKGLAKYFRD